MDPKNSEKIGRFFYSFFLLKIIAKRTVFGPGRAESLLRGIFQLPLLAARMRIPRPDPTQEWSLLGVLCRKWRPGGWPAKSLVQIPHKSGPFSVFLAGNGARAAGRPRDAFISFSFPFISFSFLFISFSFPSISFNRNGIWGNRNGIWGVPVPLLCFR